MLFAEIAEYCRNITWKTHANEYSLTDVTKEIVGSKKKLILNMTDQFYYTVTL